MPGIGGVTISPLIKLGARRSGSLTSQAKSALLSDLNANSLNDNDRIFLFADPDTPLLDLSGSGVTAELNEGAQLISGYDVRANYLKRGYVDLKYTPSINSIYYKNDDASIVIYTPDSIRNNYQLFGAKDSVYGNSQVWCIPIEATVNGSVLRINSTESLYPQLSDVRADGCFIYNRKGNTVNIWRNGIKIYEATQTPGALPAVPFYALNSIDSATGDASEKGLSVMIVRAGLTDEQAGTMNTIIQNYAQKLQLTNKKVFENNYFYYKRSFPVVQHQNGSMKFATQINQIMYSEDSGQTYVSRVFTEAEKIEFAHVFDNGKIFFANHTEIYWWDDKSNAPLLVIPKDVNGNDYIVHIPVNATYPGTYYRRINIGPVITIDGKQMTLSGTYGNVNFGANPTNLYEWWDDGTVRVIYQFGQDPYYTDTGDANGGVGGILLGDSSNPEWVRHIHSVAYDDINDEWYFCTGDEIKAEQSEVKWFKAVRDSGTGEWTFAKIIESDETTVFKSTGLNIENGIIYWGADCTGNTLNKGIYSSPLADISNVEKHTQLYLPQSTLLFSDLLKDGDVMIASGINSYGYIDYSNDNGITWNHAECIKIPGYINPSRIQNKDANGYYLIATSYYNMAAYAGINAAYAHYKNLEIKPK